MQSQVPEGNFYALYAYGSRVYGNAQPHSDYDYVAIKPEASKGEISQGPINLKMMSPEHFQKLLDEHRMTALECYFFPKNKVVKAPARPWKFKLNKNLLIETTVQRSDRDYAKAQKRFIAPYNREAEVVKGKKSIFHSIRLILFALQICEHSKIVSFSAANSIFEEIMTDPRNDLDCLEAWNDLRMDFRKLLLELKK